MDISSARPAEGNEIDRPVPSAPSNRVWGSDAIAAVLRELDIPYVALNPGASYRGIHDSLVNYLSNTRPRMLLCLHEESAVALAHGWAKVTGRPMAAFVHSNVGLMHATMAIFNAWCDRAPVLVLGATGPMDATRRRPVILAGRGSRDPAAWQQRVALAETIGARVLTDRKSGATFPTDHPLHVGGSAPILDADVILSLDWVDLAGTLRTAHAGKPVAAQIVQLSVDQYVHNGWSMDYQGLPPVD